MTEIISKTPGINLPATTTASLIQLVLGFTQNYVLIGVVIMGIFGNTFSFVIFVRTQKREDATVQYFSCLALSDTGVILVRGLTEWLDGALSFNLMNYSSITCKLLSFAVQFLMCISAWIIVCFSIERAFVVWFPLKRAIITSTKRKKVIYLICFASTVLSIYRLFLMDLIEGTPVFCFYTTDPAEGFILFQFDISLFNYIPCTLIFIANTLILLAVLKPRGEDLRRSTHKTPKEGRMLVSLMLVSTLYVVLVLPFTSVFTYLTEERPNLTENQAFFIFHTVKLLTQMCVINYCLNFIIYGCTLPFYREEARKMLAGISRVCLCHGSAPSSKSAA
jgi:hypothetical protein